jgi:hypothetical protein
MALFKASLAQCRKPQMQIKDECNAEIASFKAHQASGRGVRAAAEALPHFLPHKESCHAQAATGFPDTAQAFP